MPEPTQPHDEVRQAATLIIARRNPAGPPHFLMVERATSMAFAGGAMVFPGGAVDAADREFALAQREVCAADDLAARIAAIRETVEECGLVTAIGEAALPHDAINAMREGLKAGKSMAALAAHMALRFDFERLIPFARWCPPPRRASRRFDTHFFLTLANERHEELVPDGSETVRLSWHSARDALDSAAAGRTKIIFPTRRNLERLAQFDAVEPLFDHARSLPVTLVCPWVEERDGVKHLCIPEGLGYPVTSEPLVSALRE